MNQNLIVRAKIINLSEENIQLKLHSIRFGKAFLDTTPKAQATKTNKKIDKWVFIKIIKFSASQDTNNRVNRQPTEWEKYFQVIYLIKGCHPEYIKIFCPSTTEKVNKLNSQD